MKNTLSFYYPVEDQPHLPLLFYLPGLDGTGELLYKQIPSLRPLFNLRCLRIPPYNFQDWECLSRQVIALIKAEGAKYPSLPMYLCGESFGACLALQVALKKAELLEQLILINSASSFSKRPWLGWGIPLTRSLPDFLYSFSNLAFLPFLIATEKVDLGDRQALLKAINSIPPEVVSWRLSLLANFFLDRKRLERLRLPVLLIASQGDRLLPCLEEAQELLVYFKKAQLVTLTDSGHACLLERDLNLGQLLRQHLPQLRHPLLFS